MEINEKILCEIINYGANAEGVAIIENGKVAFVPYTIKGEKVVASVKEAKKSYINCELATVNKESGQRVSPKCPYYMVCGGCQLQHVCYNETLKIKQEIVQTAINKIAKLDFDVLPVIASPLEYGYRNKISAPFDPISKSVAMHDINNKLIAIEDCVIVENWCKKLIKITNDFIKKCNIKIYNSQTNNGLLKQLVARKVGDTLLVTLIINGKDLPNYKDYFAMLLTEFENVGLSININTKPNNYLLLDKSINLCGFENVKLNEFGVNYTINNACFLQINSMIKQKIYEQVIDETKNFDLVIDCYSGAGLLTALMSKNSNKAIGIEIVKEAVIQADNLCKENNLINVVNYCGDSAKVIYELKDEIKQNNTAVVLDPPRKGCDKKLLTTLNNVTPEKVVYVSCNPATLARDLNILCAQNDSKYKVNFIRPYDMFPQTKHVETVAVLSLK